MRRTFKLRRLAEANWVADLYDDGAKVHTTVNNYCAYQAASAAVRGGTHLREFEGAFGLVGGYMTRVAVDPCDYARRYVNGRFPDMHSHCHAIGQRLILTALPIDWSTKPGEDYWTSKRRCDSIGSDLIGMLLDVHHGMWPAGLVDARIPVTITDARHAADHVPTLTVVDDAGCVVEVHAARVALANPVRTLTPSTGAP